MNLDLLAAALPLIVAIVGLVYWLLSRRRRRITPK